MPDTTNGTDEVSWLPSEITVAEPPPTQQEHVISSALMFPDHPQHYEPPVTLQEPSQPALIPNQTIDIFHPLLDPQMLDLFPDGDVPDLSQFDTSPFNLDYFDLEMLSSTSGQDLAGAGPSTRMNDSQDILPSGWGPADSMV